MSRLTDEEAAKRARQLPGWRIEAGKLTRTFTFPDFVAAVDFVNRLTPIAEAASHHPDLQVAWGRVVVELTSHDAGGLTSKDFELAASIDRL
jgi:4a-hydroxytetrahydrobiopterin dehydratase